MLPIRTARFFAAAALCLPLTAGCSEETGEKTGDAAKKTGEAIVSGVDDAAKATSAAADELDEEIED